MTLALLAGCCLAAAAAAAPAGALAAGPGCPSVGPLTMNENQSAQAQAQCTDVGSVAYSISTAAASGTATIDALTGAITYQPNPGFVGGDSFAFQASALDGTVTQTVVVTVYGPPAAQITAPAGGQTYPIGQTVATAFACSDPRGPGIAHCQDSTGGSGSAGSLDTGTPGQHTYTVTATSQDGQTATARITYVVAARPAARIASPGNGQTYALNQLVPTSFQCSEGAGGPGIRSCDDSNGASRGSGRLSTAGLGPHTYSATATSLDGQTDTVVIHYTVAGAPTASVASPLNGESYYWQSIPAGVFSCAPGAYASLSSCTASVDGSPVGSVSGPPVALPDAIGPHTFTVRAADADGQTSTQTVTYTSTLALLPVVSITAPVFGATYAEGQVVRASYRCSAAKGGAAVRSCAGSVGNGRAINTRSVGRHTFTVTATDVTGQSNSVQLAYNVIGTSSRFAIRRVTVSRRGLATVSLTLPGPGRVSIVATAWERAHRLTYGRCTRRVTAAGGLRIGVRPNRRGRALLRARRGRKLLALVVTYTPAGRSPTRLSTRRVRLP